MSDRLNELIPSWVRHLRARNLAPRTIKSYEGSAWEFAIACADPKADEITQAMLEEYFEALMKRTSASNAATSYRRLQQLFRWLLEEGEINDSPMRRMSPPQVPEVPIPIVGPTDIKALLAACEGTRFEDRRDAAIVRVLLDTGIRASELVGLEVDDIDWDYNVLTVLGKGRKPRSVPFGTKTSEALDRYLRARRQHIYADLPDLWIGAKHAITASGVTQMIERRCARAGIDPIGLHRFRHTAAHEWLAAGGQEGDLEMLMGWAKSSGMTRRYGRSAAAERARDAHRRLGLGDRY